MKRLILLLLGVSLGVCATAYPQDKDFFFLVGADPQFGMTSSNRDFAAETANFEKFIAVANRLKPAFVIVLGDLVNKPGDPAQVEEYLRIAGKLDRSIPLYNLPGNHDLADKPTAATIAAYTKKFGPDHYTFKAGRMVGIVLNSAIIHRPDAVPELAAEQEKWFAAELEKARKEGASPLIVFMHHPLFLKAAGEPDQYFNVPLLQRQRYLELMHKFGVTHVFDGHYHRNAIARDGALEIVTSGPIGKPLGKDPSGLRVVLVLGAHIEHSYHSLDEAPERIEIRQQGIIFEAHCCAERTKPGPPPVTLQQALRIAEGYIKANKIDIAPYYLMQAKLVLPEVGRFDAFSYDTWVQGAYWWFWWVKPEGMLGDYIEFGVDMKGRAWRMGSM